MFGIRITTDRAEASREERREFIEARLAAGDTPAQAFAAWYLRVVAEETDEEMAISRRSSHRITKLALFSSLVHQMGFFLHAASGLFGPNAVVFGGNPNNPMTWVSPLSVLIGSIAIPLVIDFTTLTLVRHTTMKVASLWTIIANFLGMLIPACASAWINFNAPSLDPIFNYGFAGIALAIPLVHGLRAFFGFAFDRLDKLTKKTMAQVATPTTPVKAVRPKLSDRERRARNRDHYSTMSRSRQAAWRAAFKAKNPELFKTDDPMPEVLRKAKQINETTADVPQNA